MALAMLAIWLRSVLMRPEGPPFIPFPVGIALISMFITGIFVGTSAKGRISFWLIPAIAVSYLAVAIPMWQHLRFWHEPSVAMLAVPWLGIASAMGLVRKHGWDALPVRMLDKKGWNPSLRGIELTVVSTGSFGVYACVVQQPLTSCMWHLSSPSGRILPTQGAAPGPTQDL